MTRSRHGALLGSQTPRVGRAPRAFQSAGDLAGELAASYGLTPDPWQQLILNAWLGERRDGSWSSLVCGLAVPRQNGKNGILEMVELYKMVVLGRKILHTAHEVKTARKAFLRLCSFFENERRYPELAELLEGPPRKANGQEAIFLANGGSFELVARTTGSGLGFTVDDLVLDEAQQLSEDALAALLPTISAAPSGNPQTIYTGTPPTPAMDGEAWIRIRSAGLNGTNKRQSWHEWSLVIPPELRTPEQVKQWAKDPALWAEVNPAYRLRLLDSTIEAEWEQLGGESFARQRLGVWPVGAHDRVISAALWDLRKTAEPPVKGRKAFALDMTEDRQGVSISVALKPFWSGRTHVEVIDWKAQGEHDPVNWLAMRRASAIGVVIAKDSPAASFETALTKRGVKVIMVGTPEVASGCGMFSDGVRDDTLTHFDQPDLNDALGIARKRGVGTAGRWVWDCRNPDDDITPVTSATLALFGVETTSKGQSSAPRRLR